jgi:hypothetical protein
MTENDLLGALPLADRLRVAAVDPALNAAPKALVVACWPGRKNVSGSVHTAFMAGTHSFFVGEA